VAGYPARIEPIGEALRAGMTGRSWRADDPRCPGFDALALLRLRHVDFAGEEHDGELVVARAVADAVVEVFVRLFAARFPIHRLQRIDAFGGDDQRSMAANNSSGFNFRTIAGTTLLSHHARGLAIDLNPVQNPYQRGDLVEPPAAAGYLDRADVRPGMIVRPGPVTDAFDAIGWEWGGDWTSRKDYHHFCTK
jgi:hypothetical protein